MLGVLIPVALPFLGRGEVGFTAMIIPLSISATVVGPTPFSSVGALTSTNASEADRRPLFHSCWLGVWGWP